MASFGILYIESPQKKKKKKVLGWLPGWEPTYLLGWNLHAERNLLSGKSQSVCLCLLLEGKTTRDFKVNSIGENLNLCDCSWSPYQGAHSTTDCMPQWVFLPCPWIWLKTLLESYYSDALPSKAAQQAEKQNQVSQYFTSKLVVCGIMSWSPN